MTEALFILSLFQHGFKARWTTAYFVLIGKKTNSVFNYAVCYHLLPYFHLFPKYNKEHFFSLICQLVDQGNLVMDGQLYVQLTNKGKETLQNIPKDSIDKLYRFDDYKVNEDVFQRFLLCIQMISEKSYSNNKYFPIVNQLSIQQQLSYQWHQAKASFDEVKSSIYDELRRFLAEQSKRLAYITAYQLSGHHIVAKTTEQLASDLCCSQFEVQLYIEQLKSILCRLSATEYPWLNYFIMPQKNTESQLYIAIKEGIEKNKTISELSQQFAKKEGTVFDYIVEMAIKDKHFPFYQFISEEENMQLSQYYASHKNIGNWNFHDITTQYPTISFHSYRLFQIKEGLIC